MVVMCLVWHVKTPSVVVVVVAPLVVLVLLVAVAPMVTSFHFIAVVLGVVSQVSVPLVDH
jgi:hypothetical protein